MNDVNWQLRSILNLIGVVGCIFSTIPVIFLVLIFWGENIGLSDNLMIGIENTISFPIIYCLGAICSIIGLLGKPRYFAIIGCLFSVIILLTFACYVYMGSTSEF